jgi:hypothetical protein
MTKPQTVLMFIAGMMMTLVILMATGKARFDEARISELRRELYEQQVDNDNLRYQLKQCMVLYQGP